MDIVSSSQSSVEIQIGLFDAIIDLLLINPIFLLGVVLIGISLLVIFRKDSSISKLKIAISSLVMYYYLCLVLSNIVGVPTLPLLLRFMLRQNGYGTWRSQIR